MKNIVMNLVHAFF